IEQWRQRLPKADSVSAPLEWAGAESTISRPFAIRWKSENPANADFFPFKDKNFEISNDTARSVEGGEAILKKTLTKLEGNWPREIRGLLVLASIDKSKLPVGYEVKLTLPPVAGAALTQPPMASPP